MCFFYCVHTILLYQDNGSLPNIHLWACEADTLCEQVGFCLCGTEMDIMLILS